MRRWILARPRLALALLGVLIILPGPLLSRIELNNSPETYFPPDAPAVVLEAELRETFPEDKFLLGLFEGKNLYSNGVLEPLHALTKTLEDHRLVERVLSVTTMDHIQATANGFAVERLVDPDALDSRSPAEWRERVVTDPFAPGLVAAPDGEAFALLVRPTRLRDSMQRLELEKFFRESVARHGLEDRLTAVAGQIALDVAQFRSMIRDLALLIPGTMLVGLALLWWLFRRWLVVGLAAAAIAAVTTPAMASLALLGKPFTLITAIMPPLLTALTVAMLMHFFNAVLHAGQRGHEAGDRVSAALAAVARPTIFMALTTAAGLLSLTVSSIRPIQTFGLIAAGGVLLAGGVVLLLLPPILWRWDRGTWRIHGTRGMRWLDTVTNRAARIAIQRAGWVLAATALLLAAAVPQIHHVVAETDLYQFFDDEHPITRSTERVEQTLSGVMPMEVVFDGPGFDSLKASKRLKAMHRVQRWLDDRPEVEYSLSLPDLVAEMHWAFQGGDGASQRVIPENPQLIAQYLFIYDGRDLYDLVDRDFIRARLLLTLDVHGARAINALLTDLRGYLRAEPPADLDWHIAGEARLFADQERLLIHGQLHSLIAVSTLLTALMLMIWRSIPLAAASMVPNLAPIVLIFAVMGLLGIWLDMATAMIASVAVGIAVDDTIHLLHGYLRRRKAGASTPFALARTFRRTGRAITATTLVLSAQFLLLALSDFQPTSAFGLLTAFGLGTALVFDLLILPALLVLGGRYVSVRNGTGNNA